MLTYVVKKMNAGKKHVGRSVSTKRVRDSGGKLVKVHMIDAASRTLADDLTFVFGRSVIRARRENKQVLGVTDIAPAKCSVIRPRRKNKRVLGVTDIALAK